jgi:hypothetical protein
MGYIMIRPLNVILARIAHREQRISRMRDDNISSPAIDFEIRVLNDLKRQYVDRTNRLRVYMGVV